MREQFLAFVICTLPKNRAAEDFDVRTPPPEAEKLFERSFNVTVGPDPEIQTEYRDVRAATGQAAEAALGPSPE